MKSEPLISIVTTVYNGEDYIEESILSVINQNYNNFEYIIIDAGSSDRTLEIIHNYIGKIDKVISEPDMGIYHGMAKGVQQSNGKYFCIINADDYLYDENVLTEVSKEINEDFLDFYYGNIIVRDRFDNNKSKKINVSMNGIKSKNTIPHMSLFVKKAIYERLEGYDLSYTVAADYEFTLKMIINKCKSRKIDLTISCFRKGGYSHMNKKTVREGYLIRSKYKIERKNILYLKYLYRLILFYLKFIRNKICNINSKV